MAQSAATKGGSDQRYDPLKGHDAKRLDESLAGEEGVPRVRLTNGRHAKKNMVGEPAREILGVGAASVLERYDSNESSHVMRNVLKVATTIDLRRIEVSHSGA